MKFAFCGNLDCPEWVLSEVAILNRMSAVKLKLILGQVSKKLSGQAFDQERLSKLCRDQNLDQEETKVLLALIEFLLTQAVRFAVQDKIFSKDMLQMGVAIENANALVKVFTEQHEGMARQLKLNSLRVSQIVDMHYSVNYLLATSASGTHNSADGACEPLDINVAMNIDLKEFPKVQPQTVQQVEAGQNAVDRVIAVKFATTRDKFLQFSKDMKGALALLEQTVTSMSQAGQEEF